MASVPNYLLLLPVVPPGEDAWAEQAGAAPPGHHPGEHHAGGRDHQGGPQDLAPHHRPTLGRLTQLLHPGKRERGVWYERERCLVREGEGGRGVW